ncbi:MAG: hypothetical protein KDE51_15025, partial [Anaerolineales bacterium]|nr:hypothetical protein [Anaerolineales bacterium]
MTSKSKNIVIIAAVILLLLTGTAQAAPYMIENWVPAEYWSYMPDWVVASMGEREQNLPGVETSAVEQVNAADLVAFTQPTPTPTAEPPTNTPAPTEEPAVETNSSQET